MSQAGGRDAAVAMRDCGIATTSQTRPVCKHCFSALPIDKTSSVEAQIKLLWRSFCSSSYRVGDWSERPLGAGFRSVNPAFEVLRESRSGIHRSESSPSGSFAIEGVMWKAFSHDDILMNIMCQLWHYFSKPSPIPYKIILRWYWFFGTNYKHLTLSQGYTQWNGNESIMAQGQHMNHNPLNATQYYVISSDTVMGISPYHNICMTYLA